MFFLYPHFFSQTLPELLKLCELLREMDNCFVEQDWLMVDILKLFPETRICFWENV